jgi:hypothetical protein
MGWGWGLATGMGMLRHEATLQVQQVTGWAAQAMGLPAQVMGWAQQVTGSVAQVIGWAQ